MNNNCTKCGNPLQPGTTICPICGTNNINASAAPVAPAPVSAPEVPAPAPVTPVTPAPAAAPAPGPVPGPAPVPGPVPVAPTPVSAPATPAMPAMPAAEPAAPVAETAPAAAEPAPAMPAMSAVPSVASYGDPDIAQVKEAALRELFPLMDKINVNPVQKFRIYKDIVELTHDKSVIEPAYSAARKISDERARAEALLFLVELIDNLGL